MAAPPTVTLGNAIDFRGNSAIDAVGSLTDNSDVFGINLAPVVSLSPAVISHPEGNTGLTTYTYTLNLSRPSKDLVSVLLEIKGGTAAYPGDIFSYASGVPILPGQTSKIVEVTVQGDTTIEPDENFFYSIVGATNATVDPNAKTVTGIIQNDDFNAAPIASDDFAIAHQHTAINIDVLTNDRDPDGDPLTLRVLTNGSYGKAEVNNNGTYDTSDDFITYQPLGVFTGADSFTYQVDDGYGGTAQATVEIVANPIAIDPVSFVLGGNLMLSAVEIPHGLGQTSMAISPNELLTSILGMTANPIESDPNSDRFSSIAIDWGEKL